jgi:isoleucyl-tRNA synthetase
LARRSAQTALWHITQTLLKLMAPILSFTAEEAWSLVHPGALTLFTEVYHQPPHQADAVALTEKWNRIRQLRADITRKLEELSTTGGIGSSLQADIDIYAPAADLHVLRSLENDLRFVLIVSRADVHEGEGDTVRIDVAPSRHAKCERCWHYREDVGIDPEQPQICGRCVSNLTGAGEPRSKA